MSIPPWTKNGARAFTLIELLTVMAIIAVLIGLLLPVTGSVMNNARKTQASADLRRINNSVSSYQTEYGKLPLNDNQTQAVTNLGYDTVYGDHSSGDGTYPNVYLFSILRAIPEGTYNGDNKLNPRKVVYFEGPNVKNADKPRNGFLTKDITDGNYKLKSGSLVDPWGKEYIVWLDANGDGDMTAAAGWFYSDYNGQPVGRGPQGSVAACSMGPDGQWGTKGNYVYKGGDDVTTW